MQDFYGLGDGKMKGGMPGHLATRRHGFDSCYHKFFLRTIELRKEYNRDKVVAPGALARVY